MPYIFLKMFLVSVAGELKQERLVPSSKATANVELQLIKGQANKLFLS